MVNVQLNRYCIFDKKLFLDICAKLIKVFHTLDVIDQRKESTQARKKHQIQT